MVNISEESLIQEFAFEKTIDVDCVNCLTTITEFTNVKNFSRRTWRVAKNKLMKDIVNIFNVKMWGEIYCECGRFIEYELNENEWILIKRNVELNY